MYRGPSMRKHLYWLAILLTGCPGFGDQFEQIVGEEITYLQHVKPILDSRCVACHAAAPINGAPNSLHNYLSATQFAERIRVRSVVEQNMPPGGPLSRAETAIISAGVAAGTPLGQAAMTDAGDAGIASDGGTRGEVTYWSDIKPILDAKCVACHGEEPVAGAPNSLHDFATASEMAERIRVRTVVVQTMPPGTPLSEEEQGLIQAWVTDGAPEGSPPVEGDADVQDFGLDDSGVDEMMLDAGVGDSEVADSGSLDATPEEEPTWDNGIFADILAPSCAFEGCHGGESPSAGLDLTTHQGYIAGGENGDLTGLDNPDASLLIDHLRGRNGRRVMPLGGVPLPEETVALFERWIANGSPER